MTRSSFESALRLALASAALAGCGETTAEEPATTSDAAVIGPSDASVASAEASVSTSVPSLDAGTPLPVQDATTPPVTRDAAEPGRDATPTQPVSDAMADAASGDASTTDSSAAGDLRSIASGLDALFVDVQCAANTPTPLANGATCLHPTSTQHIERPVTLGGDPGRVYAITLRVRGIWEPTKIDGGEHPDKAHPLNVGGTLPPGTGSSDAVSYQQYSLQVSDPKQTYWLNDHQYLAHAIHKEDYQATVRVRGGAKVTVIMNDGNERQIANFTKAYFEGLAPYDKAPSTGQSLRLDVVSVAPLP